MPSALHRYVVLVALGGLAAAVATIATAAPAEPSPGQLVLIGLGVISQVFPVTLHSPGGERHTVSFSASFALALVYLGQPAAAFLLVAVADIALAVRLRLPAIKPTFNLGQDFLCVAAAAAIVGAADPAPGALAAAGAHDWAVLVAASIAFLGLNELLLAAVFVLHSGERWPRLAQHLATSDLVSTAILGAVVPIVLALYQTDALLTVLLVLPLAALEWSSLQVARHGAERLQLQQRLEQSERLEAIGRLAGGVAHDFNNLLAVMLGASDFIQSQAEAGSQIHDDARDIQHAAEAAAALTRQLLIFSRRETVADEVIDPAAVTTAMCNLLRRSIGEHIELDLQVAPEVPSVLMPRSRFEQLVLNLVVNARDAMPEGGTVTLSLGPCEHGDRTGCQLRVADTGTGMPPEVRRRIFEPFFTTKPEGRGTGLGLPTVFGVVTDAGGTIDLTSTVGEGTTFAIVLPACAAPAAATAPVAARLAGIAASGSVLVVDDDPGVRSAVCRMLDREGLRARPAVSPVEALALARRDKPVAVFTDVLMPGMTGPRLARELRALYPGLPIVLMTGFADDVLEGAPEAAAHPVLQKPFSRASVVEKLAAALAAERPPASEPAPRLRAGLG